MTDETNLLTETLEILFQYGKTSRDVKWVGVIMPNHNDPIPPMPIGSWEDFARFANLTYDAGYGGVEVNRYLIVIGDDWWLERGECDGAGWWEFKTLPVRALSRRTLEGKDLSYRGNG